MSHFTAFVSAALETAEEFGVPADRLAAFEAALLEKMRAKPEIRFVYTSEFLLQFRNQPQCVGRPKGLPDIPGVTDVAPPQSSGGWKQQNRRNNKPAFHKKAEEKPQVVLERSENAWTPARLRDSTADPKAAALRKIGGLLNKMSEDNYEKLSSDILDLLVADYVADFIPMIFDKAVWDDKFRHMYAGLCLKLMRKYGPDVFGKPLLAQCQVEFNKPPPTEPESDEADELDEYDYEVVKWKKRRLGGIHFIVELLKVKIVYPKIILACLYGLLKHDPSDPNTDNIQHAAELLIICRGNLGKAEAQMTAPSVKRLKEFLDAEKLPNREKFKVQDTLKAFGVQT